MPANEGEMQRLVGRVLTDQELQKRVRTLTGRKHESGGALEAERIAYLTRIAHSWIDVALATSDQGGIQLVRVQARPGDPNSFVDSAGWPIGGETPGMDYHHGSGGSSSYFLLADGNFARKHGGDVAYPYRLGEHSRSYKTLGVENNIPNVLRRLAEEHGFGWMP